jgi:hypothetical protein
MRDKQLQVFDRQAVFHTPGAVCLHAQEFIQSETFLYFLNAWLDHLRETDHPLMEALGQRGPAVLSAEGFQTLLAALSNARLEDAALGLPLAVDFLAPSRRSALLDFVEGFYDFWRGFDRFMVLHSEPGATGHDRNPYRAFAASIEAFTHLVRGVYRDLCENISGNHPRIYRQVPAGCNAGLIAVPRASPLPPGLRERLAGIPFIRQMWIDPPMILDPPSNTRTGRFMEVDRDPLEGMQLDPEQWLCYPAQVGPLVVFIYVHLQFVGLGCALANLFEMASDRQITAGPDALFLFGAPAETLEAFGEVPTVFHRYPDGPLVGAVPGQPRFGYFGYLKKMALTLHNVAMIGRGRMPFHGAMVRIQLRSGKASSILIIGDTATGKSESLEAFRTLGAGRIRDMRVIADDMGSLEVAPDGSVRGFGTETGAFVRLDDLQQGYAFGRLDRAIFMSPQKVNARVVLPVTRMEDVLAGHPLDAILYANNYEPTDTGHPVLERLPDLEGALATFSAGKAMSKGTTSSKGLTASYFANPFGAPQCREQHEALARRTFKAAFEHGVFVGQIRTQLAIPGQEAEGPRAVALALLELLEERT